VTLARTGPLVREQFHQLIRFASRVGLLLL
jgi:hypothetical protein